MDIKYKIWLEEDGKTIFGAGRYELLFAIDECGSLHMAAKKLHLSYRAAWGRLKASEKRLNIKLVEVSTREGGMRLTPAAREIMKGYSNLQKKIDTLIKKTGKVTAGPQKT